MNVVEYILIGLSILMIWQFIGYPLLMGLVALIFRKKNFDVSYQYFISIIVPTYNEETVIEERINNLLTLDYPKEKYEIIIVDSGSKDNTQNIVNRILKSYKGSPEIQLITENTRNGKASAINKGAENANGEIVLVTDANSLFDKEVLTKISPHFHDESIGGVCGQYIVKNAASGITNSTQFYWDIERIMREGESVIDSSCTFHGEINAWRKNIVSADTNMLTEDLDMAVQIRKKGFKIKYDPNAIVSEPAPSTVDDQIRQRKRTSIGTIQVLFKHWKYFLLPTNLYSLLIFPSHKIFTVVSPFIIMLIPIFYLIDRNPDFIVLHFIATTMTFSILFICILIVRSKLLGNAASTANIKFNIRSIVNISYYVLINEYLLLIAWKDFLFGKYSILWDKARTTR